jgi:hypothetical protein
LVTAEGSAPFNERFHLLLNLAVGGSWSANTNEGGIDSSVFPQTMAVDYVRVFECSKDPQTGAGCATFSPDAQFEKGNPAPPIIIADENYGKGDEINIYEDQFHKVLMLSGYDPEKNIEVTFVEEPNRGNVIKLVKTGDTGNAYVISPEVDLSEWESEGELVFDMKVTDATSDSELLVKMDSGWPKAGDYSVPLNSSTEWQTVRVKLSDIVSNGNRFAGGNTVNLSKVKNILVVEPLGPLTVYLDNIRLVR